MPYTPQQRADYATRIRNYEQTDAWRNRANKYRQEHGNNCAACGATPTDIHHRTYTNAFTGQEPDTDLRPLCRTHHNHVHHLTRAGGMTLTQATDHTINHQPQPTTTYSYDPRTWTDPHPTRRRSRPTQDPHQRRFPTTITALTTLILLIIYIKNGTHP